MEALRVYRTKDVVENSFDDLKNQLDMKRPRVHDSGVMDTRLFLQFLPLIFICHIRNTCNGGTGPLAFHVRGSGVQGVCGMSLPGREVRAFVLRSEETPVYPVRAAQGQPLQEENAAIWPGAYQGRRLHRAPTQGSRTEA